MNYRPRAMVDLNIAFEDYGRLQACSILPVGINIPAFNTMGIDKFTDTTIPTLFVRHSIKVKKYRHERANLRVADGLEVTIPYKDAPYSSEIIRSAVITFYAGDAVDNSGSDQQELTDAWRNSNRRFMGVVDTWHDQHNDEGHWINIKARDFSGYFIDAYYPANQKIDTSGTIVEVIQRIADTLRLGTQFIVIADDYYPSGVNSEGENLPYPGLDLTNSGMTSIAEILNIAGEQGGAAEGYSSMNVPYKMDISYWDVITAICNVEGFIPYITGELISQKQVQAGQIFSTGPTNASVNPSLISPPTEPKVIIHLRKASDIYTDNTNPPVLMWGSNIKSIEFKRKLGAIKSPVVLALSHDPFGKGKNGQTLWATYPPNAFKRLIQLAEAAPGLQVQGIRATAVDPQGKLYKAEFKTYVFPHVKSQKALQRIAEGIYHEIGRQALAGKLKTFEFSVSNKKSGYTDVLSLRSGDTIELQVKPTTIDPPDGIDELSFIRTAPISRAVTYLIGLGYDEMVANNLASAIKNPFFTIDYKIKNLVFEYDIDTGLSIEAEFCNYIVQRDQ